MPGLEHLESPALPVALGGGETVGRDRERLLVAVGNALQLAVPHVREAEALVVAGEDPIAAGFGAQRKRRSKTIVGVFEGALGLAERERRSSVVARLDRCTRLLEHCAPLVEATGGDEVVEEAGEVAGAERRRKPGKAQGESSGADPDLG